jgi:hypothetical protein
MSEERASAPNDPAIAAIGGDNCVGCGERTEFICPFCRIYARELVRICGRPECREKHESSDHGCIRTHTGKFDPARAEVGTASD